MQEIEDPAINLFAKKIPLYGANATCEMKWMEEKGEAGDDEGETKQKQQRISTDAQSQSQVPSVDVEGAEKSETSRLLKESSETSGSQGKTLKKPDKILTCPRCDSMNTKFCYYNNYNVKQPRHFCRACQRYWTVGGTMRNMPVGAGRRKNKIAASRYRHIMISGALRGAKVDVLNCVRLSHFKSKRTVPRFGVDIGKLGDECSSASSITISNSDDNGSKNFALREQKVPNHDRIPSQIRCLPGFPWPYPWNHPVSSPALYPAAAFWSWNIPLVSSHQPSSTDGLKTSFASTESAIPGKRSREPEPEIKSPKQGNGCLVVPKTLRIDDPREAAKSSIWTSLGIAQDSNVKVSLSSGFKQKGVEKVRDDEKLPALQANPAALSRSLNFRENN